MITMVIPWLLVSAPILFTLVPTQVRRSGKLDEIARSFSRVLELEVDAVKEKLNKKVAFEWIKRRVPDETIARLKENEFIWDKFRGRKSKILS